MLECHKVPLFDFYSFINDLQNNTSLKDLNFADDTLLYTTFKQKTYLQDNANLNQELNNISDWLIVNKVKLNDDKTRCTLFHSGRIFFWKDININTKVSKKP